MTTQIRPFEPPIFVVKTQMERDFPKSSKLLLWNLNKRIVSINALTAPNPPFETRLEVPLRIDPE